MWQYEIAFLPHFKVHCGALLLQLALKSPLQPVHLMLILNSARCQNHSGYIQRGQEVILGVLGRNSAFTERNQGVLVYFRVFPWEFRAGFRVFPLVILALFFELHQGWLLNEGLIIWFEPLSICRLDRTVFIEIQLLHLVLLPHIPHSIHLTSLIGTQLLVQNVLVLGFGEFLANFGPNHFSERLQSRFLLLQLWTCRR